MATSELQRTKVFISYSHKDARWLKDLQTFLAPFEDSIDLWADTRIEAGSKWREEINNALKQTKVAVLLVSANFLASNFINEVELPSILTAAEKGGARILPVIISRCLYDKTSLAPFQSLNSTDKPLDEKKPADRKKEFIKIADIIEKSIINPELEPEPEPAPTPPHLREPELVSKNTSPLPQGFMGRNEEIEKLKQLIKNGGVVVVEGMPKIGKSILAWKVAHDLYDAKELPGGVAWINYETFQTYEECLRRTSQIFLNDRLERTSLIMCEKQVQNYLQHNKSLIILDNLKEEIPEQELINWLKRIPFPSCVVVTSRRMLRGSLVYLHVTHLSETDAQELFTQKFAMGRSLRNLDERRLKVIKEICSKVDNHPLVLEIIAMRAAGLPLFRLVNIAEEYSTQDPERIWQESLSKLYESLNEDSKTMLVSLSVLPGEIGMEVINAVTGSEDWYEAAANLVATSFWDLFPNDRYMVKGLVRNFALQKLGDQREETEKRIAHIITTLAKKMSDLTQPGKFSPDEMREGLDWFDAEWLNLVTCTSYAEQNDLCNLGDSVLQFMIRRGRLKDCEELYKKVLRVHKDSGDRRGEARTLNDLGVCKQFQGNWDEAISCLQESIQLQDSLLKEDSKLIGIDQLPKTYNSLGYVYFKKGDFEKAEKAYQRSLEICEEAKRKKLSEETDKEIDLESSQTYSNLGLLRTYRGEQKPETAKNDFRNAKKDFEKSLRIKYDHDDPRIGQTYNRLGYLYQLMGNWPLAKGQFEKALSRLRDVNDKYEMGICYKGLGTIGQQQMELENAEKYFLNSLQSLQGQYHFTEEGEVHIKLAEVYRALKNPLEALKEAKKAMNILEYTSEENLKNRARKLRDDSSKQMQQ